MSKHKYIVKIQNTSFELISKCFLNEREYIKVKSIKDHEAKVFYIYSSKILFGLYKLHYDDEDEYLESIEQFEDILSNMLCLELQRYVHENAANIPVDINIKNEIKRYKNSKLTRTIFDGNRLQGFINHEEIMDENIYSDIESLFVVSKHFGIKSRIIDQYENTENLNDIKDADKIELLRDIKAKLITEFLKLNMINDTVVFKYKKQYKDESEPYMNLDINVKERQISLLNKKYSIIYLHYNLENLYFKKQYDDNKYIVGIVDSNYQIDEYGLYTLYYDNIFNKLNHFVYDDEIFFNDDLLDTIRVHPDENIIYVGNMSNFSFK